MGDYIIVLYGCGAHHNTDTPGDADVLTRAFVDNLKSQGQKVRSAVFIPIGGVTEEL